MPLDARKFLEDVRKAAEDVRRVTADQTYEQYSANEVLQWAVVRKLAIIGEAKAQLANCAPATVERISERREIVAFRNILIHRHWDVDHTVVWGVIQTDLAQLLDTVSAILAESN